MRQKINGNKKSIDCSGDLLDELIRFESKLSYYSKTARQIAIEADQFNCNEYYDNLIQLVGAHKNNLLNLNRNEPVHSILNVNVGL